MATRPMLLAALVVVGFTARPTRAADAAPTPPVPLIDRQIVAYNAHDLEAFLATYSPNIELFEFPDKSIVKGAAAMRDRYKQRLADPILHVTIADRMVLGNKVIDHELIRRTWPEGPGNWEAVVIYEMDGGLITKCWFILGDKKVDAPKGK
jgi:hypothetical protein